MWIRRTSSTIGIAALVCGIASISHAQRDAPALTPSDSRRPMFRSAVELVALNVTVLDQYKRFVGGLGPEAFALYDNGVRQELAFFAFADVPLDLALLLDLSSSMIDKMDFVRKAATGFLLTLRSHDRAMVIGFTDGVRVLQPLTSDIARVEGAIQQARANGQTGLYDAVYITLGELRREQKTYTDIRRQVVVVLSDRIDSASLKTGDEMLDAARRSSVIVYTAALKASTIPAHAWLVSRSAAEAAFTLKALAQDSGGRAFILQGPEELAAGGWRRRQKKIGFPCPRHDRREVCSALSAAALAAVTIGGVVLSRARSMRMARESTHEAPARRDKANVCRCQ